MRQMNYFNQQIDVPTNQMIKALMYLIGFMLLEGAMNSKQLKEIHQIHNLISLKI